MKEGCRRVQNVFAEHVCVEIRDAFASAVEPAGSTLGERALLNCRERERERESGHCVHVAGFVSVVNVSLLCIVCVWGHIDVCIICIESMQLCKCIRGLNINDVDICTRVCSLSAV